MKTTDQPSVVVATDGSAPGDNAVRWALEYARARRLPLRLATVADGRHETSEQAFEQVRLAFETTLMLCRSTAPDLPVTGSQRPGESVDSLLASAQNAAMLVVAATGHHRRVSAALDGHTDCPVAFVGSPRWPNPAAPVVAGISGGEQDDEILGLAYDMANRCAAPLVVVHSWHDERNGHDESQASSEAAALIEQGLVHWRAKYPAVRVHSRTSGGPPAVVLPSLTHEAGLLVIGSGTSGVATLAVRYAHCPVLVVH